jgi:hypothetical protein
MTHFPRPLLLHTHRRLDAHLSVNNVRFIIEHRGIIRFATLKDTKPKEICAELMSVYGVDAFALPTVTKWPERCHARRTDPFDVPRAGRALTGDLSEAVRSMLEEPPIC